VIQRENPYVVEKITQLVEYQDRELVSLFYRREQLKQKLLLDLVVQRIIEDFLRTPDRSVIVPIPAQHITIYKMHRFSELENIIKFLEDVYMMESKKPRGINVYTSAGKRNSIWYVYVYKRCAKEP